MHSLRFVTSLLINAGPSPSSSSSSSSSSYRVVVAAGRNNNSNSSSNIDRSSSHITLAEAIKAFTTPGYVVESIDKRLLISENILKAQHRLIPDSADRRSEGLLVPLASPATII